MIEHLSRFGCFFRAGLSVREAGDLTLEWCGENDLFFEGLCLGVNPCKLNRIGSEPWEKSYRRAIAGARASRDRDRLHNQSVKLAKGELCPHEERFPSCSDPYMPIYMRRVLSHIHEDDNKPNPDKRHVDEKKAARLLAYIS